MIEVSDDRFQQLIDQALTELPGEHVQRIQNIAIIYSDEPTPDQRHQLELRHDQTLLGLYEGLPLPARQGTTRIYPDKITLFRLPLAAMANTEAELREEIKHTLWHEIAHYYGLDHEQIAAKE
ncbi:MAG: metallopeptidase family protein [Candidatus Saccharimonadales bacterium]